MSGDQQIRLADLIELLIVEQVIPFLNTRELALFDFDAIEEWGPRLRVALAPFVPEHVAASLLAANPQYVEDARDILLKATGVDRAVLIGAVTEWVSSQQVTGYHGSRLTADEIAQVRLEGLRILRAHDREARLRKILSAHPRWISVEENLVSKIQAFGEFGVRNGYGKREGQVHLTLSRSGLVNGFNHYLTHGSEFDQNVTSVLLGDEGLRLLAAYGKPTVFHVRVPGDQALSAANPYAILTKDLPNIIREVVQSWSFWLAHPNFSSSKLETDCGMIFSKSIPPAWISTAESVSVVSRRLPS